MTFLAHTYADRSAPPQPAAASGLPWPPQACFLQARKPDGGFALFTVDQVLLPWLAYQHDLIEPLALRAYLGIREMPERRCELRPGTRACYRVPELQGLLGPAVRSSQAAAVLTTLEASGLVTWTETAVQLITHPEALRGVDLARYAALRAHVHPLLYRVPVPRRMLRYLAREGSPGLIATALGVIMRCLRYFRRDQQCRSGGTLAASWIAHCFGIAERTAYRGLATLEALGWLATVAPPPTLRHPDGPWRVVNLAWDLPPAARPLARTANRPQYPVQLELFPVVQIAASAQAPGGDTSAPEDAAAGVTDSPEPPVGEGAAAASTPAAAGALIAASLQEAAAPCASHAGEPEHRPVEAWPEDQAAAGGLVDTPTYAPVDVMSQASQAAEIAEACEALAGTATAALEAPAAPPASGAAEDLEARYAVLPAADQEALWAQARAHLMQQGTPPAFLIKPVVVAEVCRLLAKQGGPDTPEAVPHAVEAALAGAAGCKNLAVDKRHDGKNLAVPLKEGDPKPFQEMQDPELAPRGPTGAWHAQKSTERKTLLRDVQAKDLRDIERIMALHHQAAMRGWVTWSEADRLNVVAAAVHARRVGQAPGALFVALVRARRWEVLTQEDEDTARGGLRDYLYRPAPREKPETAAPAAAVPLSDDARFVDCAQRVLRQDGWRGEPFLAVKLQYPEWTRTRWECAQAELTQWRLQQAQANARSHLAYLGALLDAEELPGAEEGAE